MGHRGMYKPNPPEGLKEDYYNDDIPIRQLERKYHISSTLIYNYVERLGWKTIRRNFIGMRTKGFVHITGVAGELPAIPSLAAELMVFPRHWRTNETVSAPKDKDTYEPTSYHCFRKVT